MRRLFLVGAFLAATVTTAAAQDRIWSERLWISVSGGMQSAGSAFGDTFERPLYTETERAEVDYPVNAGAVLAASGGYRVWKRFTVGAGVTRYSQRGDATVEARLPHPFFDAQFREVSGTTSALRGETSAHLLLGWMQPLSNRLRVILTAGPSYVTVEQTLVTEVQYSEAYPYDTATFTGAKTRRASQGASGFNAGADLTWVFTPRLGAGAMIQFTRARARLNAGDNRTIAVDAGGLQAGAGVRLFF